MRPQPHRSPFDQNPSGRSALPASRRKRRFQPLFANFAGTRWTSASACSTACFLSARRGPDDAPAAPAIASGTVRVEPPRPTQAPRTGRRQKQPGGASPTEAVRAPASGLAFFDAVPYATVYVDGRRLGVTPILGASLPQGTHKLRAVSGEGHVTELTIEVSAGEPLRRRLKW